jgi:hypothetical protein
MHPGPRTGSHTTGSGPGFTAVASSPAILDSRPLYSMLTDIRPCMLSSVSSPSNSS